MEAGTGAASINGGATTERVSGRIMGEREGKKDRIYSEVKYYKSNSTRESRKSLWYWGGEGTYALAPCTSHCFLRSQG